MADTVTLIGPINLARLAEPFPAEAVSWRVGATNGDKTKGLALAYIDARDVMNRLDEVCGPTGWQDEFSETPRGRILCRIGIRCAEGWVWKGDGAGETDVESDKGAISDALKRAAVHWGIGRYLYSMPTTWVEIEQRGKTSIIKSHEYARLAQIAHGAAGGERSPSPPRQQHNSSQAKKAGLWPRFKDRIDSFTDFEELECWWRDARTQAAIDQMPTQWQEQAAEEYEKAQERLMNAGRP